MYRLLQNLGRNLLTLKPPAATVTAKGMISAYKYRIYPTDKQAEMIDKTINICRLIYNIGLEITKYAWQTQRRNVSVYDLCAQLTELKKEYTWMTEVDSQALQASLFNLEKAFKNFFKGGGYPKFKSKKYGSKSFLCRNGTRRIDWDKSLLTIPKIKNIPIVISRKFEGVIKTISISKTSTNKYFACIVVENNLPIPNKPILKSETSIGIDVGIKSYVVTSNNIRFEPNRKLKENLQRLKCLNKRASKKVKSSNNSKKSKLRIARLHERIANQRTDYIHKTTSKLLSDNQVDNYFVENLNISGLVKNKLLSLAISDVSFGEFFKQMKYKCERRGKNLFFIDRFFPSSKTCSVCGYLNNELTLSDRTWGCNECNTLHDRDLNAAINILQQGLSANSIKIFTGGHPGRACGVAAKTSGEESGKSLTRG